MQVYDLKQQVQHKAAFLNDLMLLPGRPPVLLLGHSIGPCCNAASTACQSAQSTPLIAGACTADRSLHGAACRAPDRERHPAPISTTDCQGLS